ncbi:MAG TPA: HAD family hydrolase [Tepidisphaeraceae bacterium]|jgi:histidinol-phosphate phosphatase family protein
MKRPAVFFDRDNTLIVSDGYLGDPAKVALVNGAAEAIAQARRLGYAVVVFSNQSGVARGMFSEEDVQAVNARMSELLLAENAGAVIDRHEFCPFHPAGTIDVYARESDRRKPKPGMIYSATEKLALDLARSWVIGDAGRDVEAGKATGCRTILFTDASLSKSPAAEDRPRVEPDFTAGTLAEAVAFIERNPEPPAAVAAPAAVEASASPDTAVVADAAEVAAEPAPRTSNAAAATPASPAGEAGSANGAESGAAPAAPGKRVPKVAIGSRYVPPEGKTRSSDTLPPPRFREDAEERPAGLRRLGRGVEDEELPPDLPATPSERTEALLEQIFMELRRQHEQGEADFSVSKLLAGIVQVLALATLFLAYLKKADASSLHTCLEVALVLQTMTIALLIMSRQK